MSSNEEAESDRGCLVGWLKHSSPPVEYPPHLPKPLPEPKGDRRSLHTVHIDHENKRLVTAGTDQYIKIWALTALSQPRENLDTPSPPEALLASINSGVGHVDVARFACTRNALVFGDCDGKVRMYTLSDSPPVQEFGNQQPSNVENWKLSRSVHLHSKNVLDMAWVPSDRWLATAGVDNVAVVLHGGTLEVVQRLSCDGPVRGIAWHPFGGFLTAQVEISSTEGSAAAKAMVMWETGSWAEVYSKDDGWGPDRTLRKELEYLRHSWAPDGSHCITVHCRVNSLKQKQKPRKKQFYAMIHKMGETKLSDEHPEIIRGHRQPVMVARFSPMPYCPPGVGYEAGLLIWAVAALDGRISVWRTGESSPCLLTPNALLKKRTSDDKDRFMDVAWSPDGKHLVAVSEGGYLAHWKDLSEKPSLSPATEVAADRPAAGPAAETPASNEPPSADIAGNGVRSPAQELSDLPELSAPPLPHEELLAVNGPRQDADAAGAETTHPHGSAVPINGSSVVRLLKRRSSVEAVGAKKRWALSGPADNTGTAVERGAAVSGQALPKEGASAPALTAPPAAKKRILPTPMSGSTPPNLASTPAPGAASTSVSPSEVTGSLPPAPATSEPPDQTPKQTTASPRLLPELDVGSPHPFPAKGHRAEHERDDPLPQVSSQQVGASAKPLRRRIAPVLLSDAGGANNLMPADKGRQTGQPGTLPYVPTGAPSSSRPPARRIVAEQIDHPNKRRRIVPEAVAQPSPPKPNQAPDRRQPVDPPQPSEAPAAEANQNGRGGRTEAFEAETGAEWDPLVGRVGSGVAGTPARPGPTKPTMELASPLLQTLAKGRGGVLYGARLQPAGGKVETTWREAWRGNSHEETTEFRLTVTPGGEVECSASDGSIVWRDHLPAVACCACGSPEFSAVAVMGGTLHVFNPEGLRILPPLNLGGEVLSLQASGRQCVAATETKVWVWDIAAACRSCEQRPLHDGENVVADIPSTPGTKVRGCRLAASGLPLVDTEGGQVLLWHKQLGCWVLVADGGTGLPESLYRTVPCLPGCEDRRELASNLESSLAFRGIEPTAGPVDLTHISSLSDTVLRQSAAQLQHNATAAHLLDSQPGGEFGAWVNECVRFRTACQGLPWTPPAVHWEGGSVAR